MSNGFIYVVDAHFIDKIEEENILDPSACGHYGRHQVYSCSKILKSEFFTEGQKSYKHKKKNAE